VLELLERKHMKIPTLHGTLRKAPGALGFALLIAAAPAAADWDCQDTSTGIRPSRSTQSVIGKSDSLPPEIAVPRLERLEREADRPDDKVVLYERLGKLYFRNGRFEDARRVYTAGFNLDAAATAIRENFRAALAIVLARVQRHDEVIELFERPDRPVCPSASPSGRLALAFAYTAARDYDKAETITTALLSDADSLDEEKRATFKTLYMNLGCARNDAPACVQRWDRLLRDPHRGDAATTALLERVEQLSAWPEGRTVIAAARRDGLLARSKDPQEGERVQAVTLRVTELVPLSRIAPVYPTQARAQGLSGSVELEIEIGVDGRVQKVRVLRSTPSKVFDEAALAAIRGWLFKPGSAAGKPAPVIGTQVVDFHIEHAY
jgi:TonB family protein